MRVNGCLSFPLAKDVINLVANHGVATRLKKPTRRFFGYRNHCMLPSCYKKARENRILAKKNVLLPFWILDNRYALKIRMAAVADAEAIHRPDSDHTSDIPLPGAEEDGEIKGLHTQASIVHVQPSDGPSEYVLRYLDRIFVQGEPKTPGQEATTSKL